ncbi:MAG: tetratricopeptide repeat protein [Blastocatellia bacterium]|nr:tetratricopeptide repeat protein [Blastocatellia bacterium]
MLEKMIRIFQDNQKFLPIIPFFLAICCFINTLGYDFVYDDISTIVRASPVLENWSLANLKLMFSSDMWVFLTSHLSPEEKKTMLYYRPVYVLALKLGYMFAGKTPWKWHLICVLFHSIISVVVYQLINISLQKTKILSDRIQISRFSLIASVVFTIHPAQSESVAWITALVNSLVAIKIFISLLAYLYARDLPIKSKGFIFWLCLSLLFFFLALLVKEVAVIIPVIILFYELLLFKNKLFWNKKLFPVIISGVGFFITTLFYIFLRFLFVSGKNLRLASPDFPEINNLPFYVAIYSFPTVTVNYLKILIYPFNLIPFYPVYYIYQPNLSTFYLPLLFLLIIAFILLFIAWNNHLTRLALIWLVIPILPTLNVNLFFAENLIHDRYLYFSLIGAGLLLGQLLQWLNESLKTKEQLTDTSLRPSVLVIIGVVFLVMMGATIKQNNTWFNEWQFWSATTEKFPENCTANLELGRLSLKNELPDQALYYFEQAKKACPNSLTVNDFLGFLYTSKGDFDLAEPCVRTVVKYAYTTNMQINAHLNLGFILEKKGDKVQAIDYYQKALKLDPNSQKAKELLNNLEKTSN